ncbi:MAG: FAD-dependent oxidoreductase [Deltaproteobacteria bacterium]|nr:FAD-dependent oxidoreductase [Deltaproteobacteria bacterium]
MTENYDLVVLGAGSAGLTAAIVAGRVGARVLLLDREKTGGDCTHHGCVPSKALIRCARAAHGVRHAARFGVGAAPTQVDFGRVHDFVHGAIATVASGETPEKLRAHGVETVFGGGRFLSPTSLRAGEREVRADRAIVAVGSRASAPPIPGLAEAGFLDHVALFELRELPARLAVIGGGPIGVEMGQALARLGSKVTILEAGPRILPRDDADLAGVLLDLLKLELDIVPGAKVTGVGRAGGAKTVRYEVAGEATTLECDEVLVAVGRKPNLEGLGLDAAGVQTTPRGITVDAHLRTTARNIWAAGDCTGSYQFTHFAQVQAQVATRNALFRGKQKFDEPFVPWTTFADPELAHVGLREEDARASHPEARTYRMPYAELDRAIVEGETGGLAKVVCDRHGRILGASLLGPRAGEAISEFVIAMKQGIRLQDLAGMIHAYPTMNRIVSDLGNRRFFQEGISDLTRRLFGKFRGAPPAASA